MSSRDPVRLGRRGDIVRLDVFDGLTSRLLVRMKSKTSEKSKGASMINLIKNTYGLTDAEVQHHIDTEINEERHNQEQLREAFKGSKAITWKRNEWGGII